MSQETVLEFLRERNSWVRPSEIREHLKLAEPSVYRAINSLLRGAFIERRTVDHPTREGYPKVIEVRVLEEIEHVTNTKN